MPRPVLLVHSTAEVRSAAMGLFHINELRRVGKYCVGGARRRSSDGGVATALQASEIERMLAEGGSLLLVGGARNTCNRGTKHIIGNLGGK